MRNGACCTPGKPVRRPWRCASSSSRCATAACTSCPSRSRLTAMPAGAYERASMVAAYFKQAKPRSKVLVLDANPTSPPRAPCSSAPGAISIPASSSTVAARVMAVRPDAVRTSSRRQGRRAERGAAASRGRHRSEVRLITTNNRWCDVDWRTMESKAVKGVHVLGDATLRRRQCRSRRAWRTTTPRSPPRPSSSC